MLISQFVVALASYIPAETLLDVLSGSLGRIVPGDVMAIERRDRACVTRQRPRPAIPASGVRQP